MQNKVSSGFVLNYRAETDISGGELVNLTGFVGVAATDIAKDDLGAVIVEGVFELPKATGAVSLGDALFLNADKKLAASGATFVGVAWENAAANAQTVACRINFGSVPPATGGTGKNDMDEGDEGDEGDQ